MSSQFPDKKGPLWICPPLFLILTQKHGLFMFSCTTMPYFVSVPQMQTHKMLTSRINRHLYSQRRALQSEPEKARLRWMFCQHCYDTAGLVFPSDVVIISIKGLFQSAA